MHHLHFCSSDKTLCVLYLMCGTCPISASSTRYPYISAHPTRLTKGLWPWMGQAVTALAAYYPQGSSSTNVLVSTGVVLPSKYPCVQNPAVSWGHWCFSSL